MKKIKEKHIYIFIFALALVIRALFLFYNYNLPLWGDALAYNQLARTLLEKHAYIDNTAYTSPPGYPFFLSVIYHIFGQRIEIIRIIQIIFDALLCVLLYWLGRRLFNRAIGLIAALFWATYLLFIKASICLFTESLFTFVLFLSIVCIYRSRQHFSYLAALTIGSLYAALSLTRAAILLFWPFLLIILLFSRYYRQVNRRELAKKIAVALIAFIIPISLWTYRNYRVYKTFVPISTQGGYAFYNGYFPVEGKIYGFNVGGKDVEHAMSLDSQTKMSSYLFRKTIEFIKDNPLKVLRLEVLKLLYFWSPIDWEILGEGYARYNFQYVFMLPFGILGMIILWKGFRDYVPLYAPLIYMTAIVLVFFGVPRFRMSVEPYLVLFFAVGLFRFFNFFRNKYLSLALIVSYAVINTIMYFSSATVKFFLKNIFTRLGLW